MKRQNVRTLSLIVSTFTYLLIGASIFDKLESKNENEEYQAYQNWSTKLRGICDFSDYNLDDLAKDLPRFKYYIFNGEKSRQWRFAGSFYFATTVITTIGYGHSTPRTYEGKSFCIFYAIIGIPLCIIMFQSIGERLNTYITFLIRRIKQYCSQRFRDNNHISDTHLILVSSSMGLLILSGGAYVFHTFENWRYFDALYYSFITLTTIGFGDFVALQTGNTLNTRPEYVAFSLIFILFGLTVVSSVMNLLVLRFLTMNTEDERRDELEAAAQALDLQRLQGDVILTAKAGNFYSTEVLSRKNSNLSFNKANALNPNDFYTLLGEKKLPMQCFAPHSSQDGLNSSVGKTYFQRGRVCWNYFVSLFTPNNDWRHDYAEIAAYKARYSLNQQHNHVYQPAWNDMKACNYPKMQNFERKGSDNYEATGIAELWSCRNPNNKMNEGFNHYLHRMNNSAHRIYHLECDHEENSSLGTSEDNLSSVWSRNDVRKKRASV